MLILAHPADLREKKELIYAERNPSAVSSDKDKQSELLLIKKKLKKKIPLTFFFHRFRLAGRKKISPVWSCEEQWSPLILLIER